MFVFELIYNAMKRTILFLMTAFTCGAGAYAQQLANPGFEQWDTLGDYTQPSNWFTLNPLVQFGFEPSTTLTTDAHSGNYAVVLTSIAGQFTDYSGVLCTGPILDQNFEADFSNIKVAYSSRPSHLKFYYKSLPVSGDQGILAMYLTKWNPVLWQSDTIAEASMLFDAQVNTYTLAELQFDYWNAATPDSMFVIASSSIDGFNPTPESQLVFDDFELVYDPTALSSIKQQDWAVHVYPNPASTKFFVQTPHKVCSLVLCDVNGKNIVQREKALHHQIDVSECAPGLYFLQLTDEQGNRNTRKILVN
jgi:hypothetical protein